MKRTLLVIAAAMMIATLMAQEEKEVITGSDYANDIYYSLANGIVDSAARDNWDIAFTTQIVKFDVSILINSGADVELYTYSKSDIGGWDTLAIDSVELSELPPMYNSLETLRGGAFSQNSIEGDDFDYGWGTYDMSTHTITGDSLYIVKTRNGNFKKIWIVERAASANTWEFKFANLDGTGEQSININGADFFTKNFIYFSLNSSELVDREPASDSWDLLFTRYYDQSRSNKVSGVQTNEDHVESQEVRESGMDRATFVSYEDTSFTTDFNIIGSDWKSLNFETLTYDMIDTVVYFIKSNSDGAANYYKIYFTEATLGGPFGPPVPGTVYGKYAFVQELLATVSDGTTPELQFLEVYPNPASDQLNVVFDRTGETTIQIIDLTGRSVYSSLYSAGGFSNLSLNISDLNAGFYFLRIGAGNEAEVIRFIKE